METREQKRKWNAAWRENNPESYASVKKNSTKKLKDFADKHNLSLRYVNKFGINFLEENPDVLETLKTMQLIEGKGSKVPQEIKDIRRKQSNYKASMKHYQKNKDNPEYKKKQREAVKKNAAKNKEKIKKRQAEYRKKNKEKIAQKRREYYLRVERGIINQIDKLI